MRAVTESSPSARSTPPQGLRLQVSAQLRWRDNRGAVQRARVRTRRAGIAFLVIDMPEALPLRPYQLLHVTLDADARLRADVPAPLRGERALAFVMTRTGMARVATAGTSARGTLSLRVLTPLPQGHRL